MAESVVYGLINEAIGIELNLPNRPDKPLWWSIKYLLNKLKDALSEVKELVLDAEDQKVKESEVGKLLIKLKDAVYDANDLLQEIMTEGMQRSEETWGKVCKFFTNSNPIVLNFKLMQIRKRIEEIHVEMQKFCQKREDTDVELQRPRTFSFVGKSDVIGRDGDREKVREILIENKKGLSVMAIVGIGGLGKTTLAKLVYNDARVVLHFELRMWVCVSDHFDIEQIMKRIMQSVTGIDYDNLDILPNLVQENLKDRKVLLVLDDVRNEDYVEWDKLKSLLNVVADGSSIVATTRSERVASVMGASHVHKLEGLPDDDCLSLFVKWAFRDGREKEHPHLVQIGNNIARKCAGVPLAARTLGSLLHMKYNEQMWLFVRDNELWESVHRGNDINSLLQFSYDQMPYYLKQCLAYSSLYPKNHEFYREDLIHMWMAQGYVQPFDENQKLEDIGDQYMVELLSASFFEVVDEGYDSKVKTCKMHDLLHDLMRSVTGTEFLVVDLDANDKIPETEIVRHVSISGSLGEEVPNSFLKKVRTFILLTSGHISKPILQILVSKCRHLHSLDLSMSKIKQLPRSIGKLVQLSYLNLSQNIYIKRLPNSICKLRKLQTLLVDGCMQLQRLPKNIGRIISLRHLEITVKSTSLLEIGIGGLKSLQLLSFTKCNRLTSLFNGMQDLTSLRILRMYNCPRLPSLPLSMRDLTSLESLEIRDCSEINLLEGQGMEGLKLQSLLISGLPKLVALPRGLQQAAASTLLYLCISTCYNLIALPEWVGNLSILRGIRIHECPNLLSLPEGLSRLTALQELNILGCHHLSSRCEKEKGKDWPKIADVPEIYLDGIKIQPTTAKE